MLKERWENLHNALYDQGIQIAALVPGPNLYYISGLRMSLSERVTMLLISRHRKASIVMPQLEAAKGLAMAKALEDEGVETRIDVYPYTDEEGPQKAMLRALEGLKDTGTQEGGVGEDSPFALEYRGMRILEFSLLRNALGEFQCIDAGKIFSKLRSKKDHHEIALMEKAAKLCDLGVDVARKALVPGVTGVLVSRKVEEVLKQKGAQGVGISLAIGPDTAIPHFGTSEREAAEGDLAWIDLVVSIDGYWADITRTFAIGQISSQMESVYRLVLQAQENARTKARVGMTGSEIDALARDVISAMGYGEYFIHRTGHGLGLEVHEEPYIVASNDQPLEAGSVFTVEPGVYLPGKGGVRIEDDILLTEDGPRSLTSYPRNLLDIDGKLVV